MNGPRYDLVLSSGFLAFARQAGFLEAVEQLGLAVDGVCGTSSGALAGALELDLAALEARIANREGFTYIARWVEAEKADRVRALALPGVGIDREPRRSYPAGAFAAPLLGFANIDGQGVRGIEQLENDWLTGQPRRVRVERDAKGRALALHSTDLREVQGGDVALTIDAAMQGAAALRIEPAADETGYDYRAPTDVALARLGELARKP